MSDDRRVALRRMPLDTRFLVRAQLSPWRWLALLYAVILILGFGGVGMIDGALRLGDIEALKNVDSIASAWFFWLAPVVLRHVAHGARGTLERLAWFLIPWFLVAGIMVAQYLPYLLSPVSGSGGAPAILFQPVLFAAVPCVWAWVSSLAFAFATTANRGLPSWLYLSVLSVGLGVSALFAGQVGQSTMEWFLALMAGTTVLDHLSLTRSLRRDGFLALVAAATVGATVAAVGDVATLWNAVPGPLVIAMLVPITRRARRVTAVPAGHQLYRDWGGPRVIRERSEWRLLTSWMTRWLLRAQLAPWRWLSVLSVVLLLGVYFVGGGAIALFGKFPEIQSAAKLVSVGLLWLFPVVCRHVTHGASGDVERLAWFFVPWIGFTFASFPLIAFSGLGETVLLFGAFGLAAPVWAFLSSFAYERGEALPRWAFAVLVIAAIGVPVLSASDPRTNDLVWFTILLATPAIVDHFAVSAAPLEDAALAGALVVLGIVLSMINHREEALPHLLAIAFVVTLAALASRRARRLTAVPLHHPIYVDFGGPTRG